LAYFVLVLPSIIPLLYTLSLTKIGPVENHLTIVEYFFKAYQSEKQALTPPKSIKSYIQLTNQRGNQLKQAHYLTVNKQINCIFE
jgi:hypothetical protein